jgi:hypothetical protein
LQVILLFNMNLKLKSTVLYELFTKIKIQFIINLDFLV